MDKKEYIVLSTAVYESILNMLSELQYKSSAKIISDLVVNAKENINLNVLDATKDEGPQSSNATTN